MTQILDILRVFAEAAEPVTVRQVADVLGMDRRRCGKQVDRLRAYGCMVWAHDVMPYRYRVTRAGLKRLGVPCEEPSGASIEAAEPERLTLVQKALRARPELQQAWT